MLITRIYQHPDLTHRVLVLLVMLTLSQWACEASDQASEQGFSDDSSQSDRAGAEAQTGEYHPNADSDYGHHAGERTAEFSAGESAGDFSTGEDSDERLTTDENAPGSQTWQESEAAQRQPIVDVGGGNTLTLHSQRVSTVVEGHRARTIVDQIFYSPYDRQLEGTFRYSLPVGATVSQYALYIGRIT